MAISKTVTSLVYANPRWTVATILTLIILVIYYQLALRVKRARLPVYSNHTGLFASWHDAMDYVWDSPGVLKRGYDKVCDSLLYRILMTELGSILDMATSSNFARLRDGWSLCRLDSSKRSARRHRIN